MIFTERLLIRPYHTSDTQVFYDTLKGNAAYLEDYFYNMLQTCDTPELTAYFLSLKEDGWKENNGFACGIFLKETEQFIGHISVREIDWRVPKGELAYFIAQASAGKNYGGEALKAFRDWCFFTKRFNRLFMKISPVNIASIRVAEKAEFLKEGTLRKDYKKRGKDLVDMDIYGYTWDIQIKRVNGGENEQFIKLTKDLDFDLWLRYGQKQDFFNEFNKLDDIKHALVLYVNDCPIGCGAFKFYSDSHVEIKRMFVHKDYRGRGFAHLILDELESWAKEVGFNNCILETGVEQPEAIRLYEKSGYDRIANYGQYIGIEESICMEKSL
jgi:RimJ/RimL family protein N-acetyltransferase